MSKQETLYKVHTTANFKKDLKRIIKQGKNINKLESIVTRLANKEKLDQKYKDHPLYNNQRFKDCRDCHVEPDWILIYKYLETDIVLLLINTGSHSQVLDK